MMLTIIISVLISLFTALYAWTKWHKVTKNLPPGPWSLPFIGYLPWMDSKAPYLSLTKLSQKFGSIYGIYLGNTYAVVISEAKLIKKVFSKDVASGRPHLFLTHAIMKGNGLISSQGELWKNQRKVVHDFLRNLCISRTEENKKCIEIIIMKHALDFVQHFKSIGDKIVLYPEEFLRHSVGSVITEIIVGKTWPRNNDTWKYLLHIQEEGTRYLGVAGPLNFFPFLRLLPMYKKPFHFLIEVVQGMHKIFQEIIDEEQDNFDSDKTPSNLIQAYIEYKNKSKGTDSEKFFSDQQFHHVLSDMFGAGLDTSLHTLGWYLLYIAKHQHIQTKIRQELIDVLEGNPPTLSDLSRLPYIKASIAEVQRIQTTAPLGIPHAALEDLDIRGYKIPKGTMIIVPLWALHMDPEIWECPEHFKPERFIDDEGKFYTPESFIPYLTGKRMCVGDEIAKNLLFLFSATITQHFKIDLENLTNVDLNGVCGITLSPKPHKLIFTRLM